MSVVEQLRTDLDAILASLNDAPKEANQAGAEALAVIKQQKLLIENVEMEAFLHTYDNLSAGVCRKFQPIVLKQHLKNQRKHS